MLNFSWKFNDTTFFFPKSKKFLPKFIKSVNSFANPLDDFTPAFSTASSNTDFIFPLLIDDNFILMKQLTSFENCLIFLLNFFYKSDSTVKLNEIVVNFLYNYLVYSGLLVLNKKAFVSSLSNFKGVSYADFNLFLLERVNLLDIDCNFHKERIVVEYTAFKR